MHSLIWITFGGAIGTAARFGLSGLVARLVGETFPWGTIIVNISGCLAIGFFFTMTGTQGRWLVSPAIRQFFTLGVCGGYTTFSTFSLETLTLVERGQWTKATANVLVSVLFCLVAVWFGHLVANSLNSMKGN